LDSPDKNGETLRKQLTAVYKKTKNQPKKLKDLIELKSTDHLIVTLFWKLTSLGSNDNNFTIIDIQAYSNMFSTYISPWDIDALTAMQRAKQYSQQERMK